MDILVAMLDYRLPCVSLGLMMYLQTSFSRTCDVEFNSIPSKTYQADYVFEARVHRMPATGAGKGSKEKAVVRFRVNEVLKGTLGKEANSDRYRTVSVGWFGLREDPGRCVAPMPQLGSRYVLFLRSAETDSGIRTTAGGKVDVLSPDFVITSFPEPFSEDVISAVNRSAHNKFGRKPKVRMSLKNLTFKAGQSARVQCIVTGRPSPKVNWFKDGTQLQSTKRISFLDTKRGSTLVIRRLSLPDSGTYQCQAVNAVGSTSLKSTKGVFVSVASSATSTKGVASSTTETPRSSDKAHSLLCDTVDFCFNGGTCYVIPSLGQTFCQCPSENVGLRCEEKRPGITDAFVVVGKAKKRRLFPTPYAM